MRAWERDARIDSATSCLQQTCHLQALLMPEEDSNPRHADYDSEVLWL
jgi:hypothetical protein